MSCNKKADMDQYRQCKRKVPIRMKSKHLQEQLKAHDLVLDKRFAPDFETEVDYKDIQRHATQYFNEEIPLMEHTDMTSLHLILRYFKNIYLDLVHNKEEYLQIKREQTLEELKNKPIPIFPVKTEEKKGDKSKKLKTSKKEKSVKKDSKTEHKGKKESTKEEKGDQESQGKSDKGKKKKNGAHKKSNKLDKQIEFFCKSKMDPKRLDEIERLNITNENMKMKLVKMTGEYNRSLLKTMQMRLECISNIEGKNTQSEGKVDVNNDYLTNMYKKLQRENRDCGGHSVMDDAKLDAIREEERHQNKMFQEIRRLRDTFLHQQNMLSDMSNEIKVEFQNFSQIDEGHEGTTLETKHGNESRDAEKKVTFK